MEGYHNPVLLKETIEALNIKPGNWYLDCTLGDGGHSLEILNLGGNIVGVDVDPEAIERVRDRFKKLGIDENRFRLVKSNFSDTDKLKTETNQKFKGVIFDLGVSSLQFETPSRGFSFGKDGPLDMRMDPELGVQAIDLINALSRKELYELFSKLGEEKLARQLADALVLSRQVIHTTKDLADLVTEVYKRYGIGPKRIHPATKVFQALRIAVNDELGNLREALPKVLEQLEKDGIMVVISFHSLEDRIIKDAFRDWQSLGLGQSVNKLILPSELEVEKNPRSRSSKMRIFKKS